MKKLLLACLILSIFSVHAGLIENPDKNNDQYISSILGKLNLKTDLSKSHMNIFIGDKCSVVVKFEANQGRAKKLEVMVENETKSKIVIYADASGARHQSGRCFNATKPRSSCVSANEQHFEIKTKTLFTKKQASLSIISRRDDASVVLSVGDALLGNTSSCSILL